MADTVTQEFDADVGKVLQLVIHSLYENTDIFLRELVSNASDACDKLRYQAITKPELLKDDPELAITVSFDKKARTITIADNGVGMTREEMVKNLGTIARSGTQNFLEKLTGDAKKDTQLIGQFGVGFYSSFMVADSVTVTSLKAGKKSAHTWKSAGEGKFSVAPAADDHQRGTTITLHVKKDAEEYLDAHRLRHIIHTYSDHVAFPIELIDEEGEKEKVNEASALWSRPKSKITEEQYSEFYHHIAHAGDAPWMVLHNKAEGKIEYTNLLFIPSTRPFDVFHPDRTCRVKLYVKRVFITEEHAELVPSYLRFLRGVVDSEDLPLNISRETLQHSAVVQKIRQSITKRVLSELKKRAAEDSEGYAAFWQNFGAVLKEGLCEATADHEKILEVCRFTSSTSGEALTNLDEYCTRMPEDQKEIYYITGDSLEAVRQSPHLEGFAKRGMEVLLLTDGVDDFWVNVVQEYKGTPLRSITRAGVQLDGDGKTEEGQDANAEKQKKLDDTHQGVVTFFTETLGDAVQEVRISQKLTDSPACLVAPEYGMDMRLEQFLVENKQLASKSAKILEINPDHAVVKAITEGLGAQQDVTKLQDAAHVIFAQASVVEGEPLKDIAGFSRRITALLEKNLAA